MWINNIKSTLMQCEYVTSQSTNVMVSNANGVQGSLLCASRTNKQNQMRRKKKKNVFNLLWFCIFPVLSCLI